jgi:hypothetical protein
MILVRLGDLKVLFELPLDSRNFESAALADNGMSASA